MADDNYAELGFLRHQARGESTEGYHVERVLANTLGYTLSPTDDPTSPCPGEYAVGDHTPTTLAMEAAWEIMRLRGDVVTDTARQELLDHWLTPPAAAPDTDGVGDTA